MKKLIRKIKHNSFVRNMRRNPKMRRYVILALLIVLAAAGYLIYKDIKDRKVYDMSDVVAEMDDDAYTVQYKGESYAYNNHITNILLIGIDSTGKMETSATYGGQARADSIELIVFDEENKEVKLLPISRDTQTAVTTYSSKGYETGSETKHLALAYTYGNGGNVSSMNVCEAVSKLLFGTEVYRYVTTNRDSLAFANELVGGVTVTVPNNDLVVKYIEMVKGNEVELTDDNIEDFLRYRTGEIGSNNGRMERQEAFLQAFVERLETMSEDDYLEMWDKLSSDETRIRTNIDKSTFLNLIANIKEYNYVPERDNLHIKGTNKVENNYDVFYPDTEELKKLVVDTFFK